ncbi:MAG: hypothetical protein ACI9UK_002442 [Candidatus Krumholzibacteriia bacterium]|jgi:hypothetical protein
MKKMLLLLPIIATLVLALGSAAVAQTEHPQAADQPQEAVKSFAEFIAPSDSLPHLRYFADNKATLNNRCPVRLVRLNPRMGASYVNDQPVGFC